MTGTVYLIHFTPRYKHAGHYLGYTDLPVEVRLQQHLDGAGARLTAVAVAAGVRLELARTWPGSKNRERQLKNQGGASRMCPLCGIRPQKPHRPVR